MRNYKEDKQAEAQSGSESKEKVDVRLIVKC
jgi:hypothetical protein